MKTEVYVEHGKWVTDHIVPINAAMTIFAAAFIPLLDVLRPYFPHIDYVVGLAVLVLLALLVTKVLGILRGKQLQTSTVICSGVCVAALSVGATASVRHADQGGAIATSASWVIQLQQTLPGIKDGKSDNPCVEPKNVGMEQTPGNLFRASKDGDTKVVELFLKGGVPVTFNGIGNDRQLLSYAVANSYPKAREQLKLFKESGVDLNDPQLAAPNNTDLSTQPPNLYAVAKDHRHEELVPYLAELGVKTDNHPAWQKRKEEMQKKNKGIYLS